MLRGSKAWDVRCPKRLANMFPERTGYYYKINRVQARRIVAILSREYGIRKPTISGETPPAGRNGDCTYGPRGHSVIRIHARGHMKTTLHEFYHALDHATDGRYNSSDRQNLAWQFADLLFDQLRKTPPSKRKTAR